jgi:FkbM family methyltransferase
VAVAAQTFHRLPLTTRVALLEGMPGGEEFVRPGRAQKSGGKTLTLDLTAGSRELAITLPDDSGIRAVVDEIINKKIYTPPAGIGAPRSILDIGANVGIAAAYFRAVYPDAVIHCVEPDPVAYDFLVNNARKIGNCLTYHAGLYNATCLRPFYFGESSVHNSIAAIPGQPTRLLCIDAKNFVSSLSVAKFDLIKIDTEGAELPIMWSLRDVLEQTPVIHLEYHSHRDRRLMDEMLTTSHYLSHGTVDSAHRGQLTYILHDLSRSPAMHEPLS